MVQTWSIWGVSWRIRIELHVSFTFLMNPSRCLIKSHIWARQITRHDEFARIYYIFMTCTWPRTSSRRDRPHFPLGTAHRESKRRPRAAQRAAKIVSQGHEGHHRAAFGRLGIGNYPNLAATWSPKQTQAGDCVLSQNIVKPMLFLGFGSLSQFGRVGKLRNRSNRLLKELKTRSKWG